MATLNPASAAAIARLRSYVPPPTTWQSLPLSRRAAVLILLFADKKGDLRVVLTMRAATLKSYAGQAALPGGKSDSLAETAFDTARREAWEEIGLPLGEGSDASNNSSGNNGSQRAPPSAATSMSQPGKNTRGTAQQPPSLPYPFKLEHLCQLPTNLAKTELGVRPCVAFLYATSPFDKSQKAVDVESMLIPRLDAKEVAAVFTARFHNFLREHDEVPVPRDPSRKDEGVWYKGVWTDWHETQFRMHNFFVPVRDQVVTRPKRARDKDEAGAMADAIERAGSESDQTDQTTWKSLHGARRTPAPSAKSQGKSSAASASQYPRPSSTIPYRDFPDPESPDPLDSMARFRVFGMTARILVDCARAAYGEEPEFEHNSHFGDEAILERLLETGRFETERGREDEFTAGELAKMISGQGDAMGGATTRKSKKQQASGSPSSRL